VTGVDPAGSSDVRRRAVLLSGSLGKGHDTLAEGCATSLGEYGFASNIHDSMALLGRGGSIGDWVFRQLFSISPVYDAFHFSQLRAGGRLARFCDRAAYNVMWPRFLAAMERDRPELIVSVFATGAAVAAGYKRERPDVRTIVFITDVVAHRMWVHDETDLFLVTSDASAAAVRRYRPTADVMVVDAPVRREFYAVPSMADAREQLGVAELSERCVLLMAGGWGVGPLDDVAEVLAGRNITVLAVAGHNQKLYRRLQESAASNPLIVPFAYTSRIPELMAASDLVVTSAGDTCREARVVGRPMVLLDVVPGHGRENLMHELELGDASVASDDPELLASTIEAALKQRRAPSPSGATASWDSWQTTFADALMRAGISLD
jgi:UDP-N-acetylglucosamine:LPS N-acetylglucosamine transferase